MRRRFDLLDVLAHVSAPGRGLPVDALLIFWLTVLRSQFGTSNTRAKAPRPPEMLFRRE